MLIFWPLVCIYCEDVLVQASHQQWREQRLITRMQSSGISLMWAMTRRHCYLIIILSLTRPGNFLPPKDHVQRTLATSCAIDRNWLRGAIRDSTIESNMRRSALKVFHIVSRDTKEEARISAYSVGDHSLQALPLNFKKHVAIQFFAVCHRSQWHVLFSCRWLRTWRQYSYTHNAG